MAERKTTFVDVILPLALPRLLTYRVPSSLDQMILSGQRVVVQLGKNKLNTGLIKTVHHSAPAGYQAKYIEDILDQRPLVTEKQIKLWEWISEYYCCTQGEVMNAALPGGLKLSSETKFALSDTASFYETILSTKEETIIEALRHRETMTVRDISSLLEQKSVQTLLKGLIEKKLIISSEELKEKFRPKKTDFIKLGDAANSEKKLEELFDVLEKRRAQKQSEVLMTMLQITKWDEGKNVEVERIKLQEKAGVGSSVIAAMIEKKIFEIYSRETGRLGQHLLSSAPPPVLSVPQLRALREIEEAWNQKSVVLLKGVTSSGKTEIYSTLIQQTLEQGKQVLFLLPEIALTTQIIDRLKNYFGKRVGIYHSGYSENERTEVWNKVLSNDPGECDVILGARSSLFLPWCRLGLIIVDEEHEQSFKQHDPAPRYHARDTAIVLAKKFNARVLLGSATPSVETYFNAQQGRFGLVELNDRYGGIELPEIIINDLRKDLRAKKMKGSFSPLLISEMEATFESGRQVILFQNRRGYSPLWQCHNCGWIPQCTRCDVSLTYHKSAHQLKCHYCGYSSHPPSGCAACGSTDLRMLGFGTEKIEEELCALFPEIKVQRMDFDTTRSKSGYQKIINGFGRGEIQVLIGTQMVTKGLDFDNVSLVGILNADKMMNFPDFRSMERSYQLMMQVAGRAGRRGTRGKVIIQTYSPGHWLLDLVVKGDYEKLYDHEMRERYHYGYPPLLRMIKVTVKHREDDRAEATARAIAVKLKMVFGDKLLGPEKPPVPKINNLFLWQMIIKLDRNAHLQEMKNSLVMLCGEVTRSGSFSSARVVFDVDPV
ncbi:MAG: primosomal protein N' [Crocinitomicaceae bacterium]|nr:primosomal protein N' [Crocinitomicaceae bacterium]